MKKYYSILIVVFLFMSCTLKSEIESLNDKIKNLETELDNCLHGADKLYAKLIEANEMKKYGHVQDLYNELKTRHPEFNKLKETTEIYEKAFLAEEEDLRKIAFEKEKVEAEKKIALDKLKKNYDDVSGWTWYETPYLIHYNNRHLTSLYLGQKENTILLRLKMSYNGIGWIFFEDAYLSYDGNTQYIYFDKYQNKKSEIGSDGTVHEWIDVKVSDLTVDFLENLVKSKTPKMRLSGKYTKTRTLSKKEIDGIDLVLKAYAYLKENN
ncbi:hypothetical protein [Flavobacterium sp. NKUCC04_CG]|uniref:hypothetical protein n=1 Tax=Flavobacterium sp. NKUCC04_CG TaxID=2842121 RepID=UPI001C5AD0A0|nr:hypothetical protein [Flavobacterium sp. NKUCC04_CG]MBW3519512.1 hypothetical protein [Flavobacterium sp. NKUCC04_CG]